MSGALLAGALLALALLAAPRRGRAAGGRRTSGAGGAWEPPPAGDGRAGRGRTGRAGRRAGPGRPARERADDAELLVLLEALEPALRAGLPVRAALEGPAAATPLGSALAAADARGAPLGPVWGDRARRSGSTAAAVVHRTWRLSERVGSPLADGVADAAEEVRAAADRRRRVAAAVAGPRTTARLLTVLPLAGPLLALALGLRPGELWGGPGGPLALLGTVLVGLGHLWCRALLRDVTRPRPVGAP